MEFENKLDHQDVEASLPQEVSCVIETADFIPVTLFEALEEGDEAVIMALLNKIVERAAQERLGIDIVLKIMERKEIALSIQTQEWLKELYGMHAHAVGGKL